MSEDPFNQPPPAPAAEPEPVPKRKRRRINKFRLAFILLLLALASLFIPAVFQIVARQVIYFVAWQHSASVQIAEIEGSLFEPLSLKSVRLTQISRNGVVLRLEIDQAKAEFNWRWHDLISPAGPRWFRRLALDGVQGEIQLPPEAGPAEEPAKPKSRSDSRHGGPWNVPERFEANRVNLVLLNGVHFLRLTGASFAFSQVEPGALHADQVVLNESWLSHSFRNVNGATAVEESNAFVTKLALEPGIEIERLSANLPDLEDGRLNGDLQLAAFGGEFRAQIQTVASRLASGIDASGQFSKIQVAQLATFLNLSDAAGGVITDGQFTFHGKPAEAARATASLRLTAKNFQWESRQWDSLVLGATLMDRRLSVPELELRQGHNQLSLNGELTLPAQGKVWWQSDFNCNLSARIENLTEISALMLPEFTYTAGRMSIDGGIRGRDQQFHGAVIVSGSGITWHDAPIEDLRAAIRLNGNELQIANLDLLNKDDFVRGRGVINILGEKQYWGELRASISDLATYSAILRKPILPEPLAGGARIDWSGEGSAKSFSGKFSASLNKLRTLGATGAMIHPVNADLDGNYAQTAKQSYLQFSRFSVSDDESVFTANVTVSDKAVTLGAIHLTHGNDLWLEGDAVLPLDLWHAWPNSTWESLLSEQTPLSLNLTATHLQIREAAQLTGWKWPIEGVVDGAISASGKFSDLTGGGKLAISHGQAPLGLSKERLSNIDASLVLSGSTLELERFACSSPAHGNLAIGGRIDLASIHDPSLQLTLHSDRFEANLFPSLAKPGAPAAPEIPGRVPSQLTVTTSLDVELAGPASRATVSGQAHPTSIRLNETPDLTTWFSNGASLSAVPPPPSLNQRNPVQLPPTFVWTEFPWHNWRLAVQCSTTDPVAVQPAPSGEANIDVKISGTGAAPTLAGDVRFSGVPAAIARQPVSIKGEATWRPNALEDPTIDFAADGKLYGCDFTAYASGPLSHCARFFTCEPPLTVPRLVLELDSQANDSTGPFSERDPLAWTAEGGVFTWPSPMNEHSPDSAPQNPPQ